MRFKLIDVVTITLVSLCVVLIGSLSTLRHRQSARGSLCERRLQNLARSIYHYHSAFKQLPHSQGGSSGTDDRKCNRGRLSGFAAILPFIDQQAAWEALSNSSDGFPPMGPAPSIDPAEYTLWGLQIDAYLCPEETATRKDYGLRSYMFSYGDGVFRVGRSLYDQKRPGKNLDVTALRFALREQRASCRGMFVPGERNAMRSVLDGLSNTIMLSETVVDVGKLTSAGSVAREIDGIVNRPSLALNTVDGSQYRHDVSLWSVGKGSRWAEGSFIVNAFTTVLPPSSPSATLKGDPTSGCISATSHHPGGVHVAMGDGSVRFISDSIDTGSLESPSVCIENENAGAKSPYGVWGAMGSRASKEIIPSEREADFTTLTDPASR